ncbi:MAG: hypothetical protein LBG48_03750 [Rickettsiales bacterium]|jgi:hypothetical protein|nr:hypothetical protein [Rickettsiales bacterium]
MLYKAGTVKEMQKIREEASGLPDEVLSEALRIVKILDEVYGADRDVDNGDGGFVLIAENIQDLALLKQQYVDLESNQQEVVAIVQCGKEPWLNALFLCNNEFGINVLIPVSIAPNKVAIFAKIQ